LNADFCDVAEGEVSLPPITLKQRRFKTRIFCSKLFSYANLFFNYATHTSTPDEVLEKMINAADEAFQNSIDNLNTQYERFCKLANREYKKLPWKSRVISYEELYNTVKARTWR